VFELTKPYRTNNEALIDFWSKVRHLNDGIEESIAQNNYSAVLDHSLFQAQRDDEIILCLNYDGLFGTQTRELQRLAEEIGLSTETDGHSASS
jgi:hypothetical protein